MLTFGKDKLAAGEYLSTKNGVEGKPFIKNARLAIKINGSEMTRLQAVEEIAKSNLDESVMKLNKSERDYLRWLRENLIDRLKKIQQAGIQNERASNIYHSTVDGKSVYFENSKNDAATLGQLTKLAEVFGGTVQKNQSDNTRFYFTTPRDAWTFIRNAEFFTNNRHVEYFNPDSARKRKNTLASIKKFIENIRTELYKLTEAEKISFD